MRLAITKEVSGEIARCELTHLQRRTIDPDVARRQHAEYRALLTELGCTVVHLPADEHADSVFVEDVALVLDELAVLTRPGVASRRDERPAVEALLRRFREIVAIEPPAALDGGDVMVVGKRVWVGTGGRSNEAAVEQLRGALGPLGYRVLEVRAEGCLHLKSAATPAGDEHVVLNPEWIAPEAFPGMRIIETDRAEPFAANVLTVGETVIVAAAHPRTRRRLEAEGLSCRSVDASELAKAEGALTCSSLLFDV